GGGRLLLGLAVIGEHLAGKVLRRVALRLLLGDAGLLDLGEAAACRLGDELAIDLTGRRGGGDLLRQRRSGDERGERCQCDETVHLDPPLLSRPARMSGPLTHWGTAASPLACPARADRCGVPSVYDGLPP